jgi:hypothetical protein
MEAVQFQNPKPSSLTTDNLTAKSRAFVKARIPPALDGTLNQRVNTKGPKGKPMSEAASRPAGLRAVVTGATGAIGKHLVAELLLSPRWERVTVIGR